jgi:hypothetical protein
MVTMKKRTGGLFRPIPGSEPAPDRKPPTASTVMDDIMTDDEVMVYLKVNKQWLRDHTTRTEPIIPHVPFGRKIRYRRSDVMEFVESRVERRPVWDRKTIAA